MKFLKVISIIALIIAVIILGSGVYLKTFLPNVGDAPEIKIEPNEQMVERGRYLANHVAVCIDCHSTRKWDEFSAPLVVGTEGKGGEKFSKDMGFPGAFYAPNITPHGIGDWTDGELFRAITSGVQKEGRALFPLMAYHRFGQMDSLDIISIIAYIRTLPAIESNVPTSEADFPVNFLINTMPKKATFTKMPQPSTSPEYGKYLVNAAGCIDCHSQTDKGFVVAGTELGGGMAFQQPAGTLVTPNITFDTETGIGNWTKDDFIRKFKMYMDSGYVVPKVSPNEYNSPMPWSMYAGMSEDDLTAIYNYLKSVTPIKHKIVKFTPNS